jgi:hypothetical protein
MAQGRASGSVHPALRVPRYNTLSFFKKNERLGSLKERSLSGLEEDLSQLAVKDTKGGSAKQKVKAVQKVIIKRVERNKRKFVTTVFGLETHGKTTHDGDA